MRAIRSRRGFSLLELVIVVAIIALVAAVAIPLLAAASPQQRLREAAAELSSNIRLARSMAVSGQTAGSGQPINSVQVTFNDAANTYSIVLVDNLGVPTNVKTVAMSGYAGANIDLVPTIAPTPTVIFQKNGSADRIATITLTELNINQSKIVEITRAGLSRVN